MVRKYTDSALALLRANLGFYNTEIPADLEVYLRKLLEYSFDAFRGAGIDLSVGCLTDDMDQMSFAAWMYRNGTSNAGKPQQLREMIRNRQVRLALEADE